MKMTYFFDDHENGKSQYLSHAFLPKSIVTNGSFIGLAQTTHNDVKHLLNENLYPRYSQDCSDPTTQVNFFVVFGVLFSGW